MSELSQERLEVELALKPQPLTAIVEDDSWFHVGALSVSKHFPRFSAGFAHPIVPSTHFVLQSFFVKGQRGWALVLVSGGTPSHYFAGWLPDEEEARGKLWVDRLNIEIQQRLGGQLKERAERDQAKNELSAETLTCQFVSFSNEEVLRLARGGEVEYMRREGGQQKHHLRGRIDPSRFEALISTLGTTSFPTPPQRFFPPGASICTLVVEPPERRMALQYDTAVLLHGYGEILRALESLCGALREMKREVLATWDFEQTRGE